MAACILPALLALLLALAGAPALATPAPLAAAAPRVNVTLYAEALCPYCAQFTTHTLGALMRKPGFADIINFRYVAWGNAVDTKHGVVCQHGPAECRLDRIINCATHLRPDQAAWLPFVLCLEGTPGDQMEEAVGECAEEAGFDVKALRECATGAEGDELERAAAEETGALQPPHTYVPWVLVQGIPLGDTFDQLQRYVCVAYTGQRPDACFDAPDAGDANGPGAAAGGGADVAAVKAGMELGVGPGRKGTCPAAGVDAEGSSSHSIA